MTDNRFVVWSNFGLDIEDGWREAYAEFLEINGLDLDPSDEYAIYQYMQETNASYLDDERMNLDVKLSGNIVAIADLGLWNGRRMGYQEIGSNNIRDCLTPYHSCDYHEWYVDREGDLRCRAAHHDGTNYVLYRAYRDDVTEEQIEEFLDKVYDGKATQDDIEAVTRRIGDEVAKVYGWDLDALLIDLSPYKDKGFDKEQFAQIKGALQFYKLTEEQVALFARPEFSAPQMAQLIYGLSAGLPMEPYAKPEYSWQELLEIRKKLAEEKQKGVALDDKLSDAQGRAGSIKEGAAKDEYGLE